MTTALPNNASGLIPGAYERTALLQGAGHTVEGGASVAANGRFHAAAPASTSCVTTAPRQPSTWGAQSVAVLADLALAVGIVFTIALMPVLAVNLLAAAVRLLVRAGAALAERL